MIIIYTAVVGFGLIWCGYLLGAFRTAREDILLIHSFIDEMVDAKLISEKKLSTYMVKTYGSGGKKFIKNR